MNILALDLGTNVGYAYNQGTAFQAGTWTLATDTEVAKWGKVRLTRRKDPRIERLCEHLSKLPQFDAIVIEDVQFQSARKQAHLWAGLRSAVWLCLKGKVFEAVDVKVLKKFAGYGGADKDAMRRLLYARHPKMLPYLDDNGVDACWIWHWAKENLGRIKQ